MNYLDRKFQDIINKQDKTACLEIKTSNNLIAGGVNDMGRTYLVNRTRHFYIVIN